MVEKKAFLANHINIVYPNEVNMIVVPNNKRAKIIMGIYVCLISWINSDYKENDGRKSFSCISKASISCIPMRRT